MEGGAQQGGLRKKLIAWGGAGLRSELKRTAAQLRAQLWAGNWINPDPDSGLLLCAQLWAQFWAVSCVCVEDNCSQHSNSHNLLTPTYPLCDTPCAPILVTGLLLPLTVILLQDQISKIRHGIAYFATPWYICQIYSPSFERPLSFHWSKILAVFPHDSDKCVLLRGYMGSPLYVSTKCPFWVGS